MLLRYGPHRRPLSPPPAAGQPRNLASVEAFLFAEVGLQDNGLPLTVNSMLARQGKDPWAEAASLARLPMEQALDFLTAAIGAAPLHEKSEAAETATAIRLLRLLHCTRDSRPGYAAATADKAAGTISHKAVRPSPRRKHSPEHPRHGIRIGILIGAGLILLAIGLADPKALFTDPNTPAGIVTAAHPAIVPSGQQ